MGKARGERVNVIVTKVRLCSGAHAEHGSSRVSAPSNEMTDREHGILQWLAYGKKRSEIAELMDCSIGTVYIGMHRIMNKLGANTIVGAVAIAIRKGLIK